MGRLLLGLVLALGDPPEPPAIQRPGDAVVWAFDWDAPGGCPGRAEVIAAIRGYLPELDEPPIAPTRADLRIVARVEGEGDEWTASLRMSGRDGEAERRFSAPACAELAEATALIAAVALDPVLVARQVREAGAEHEHEPEPEPEVEPEPEHEVEPELQPIEGPAEAPTSEPELDLVLGPDEPPSPERARPGLAFGVVGLGGHGPTTNGFFALAGSFAVFGRRWRAQLEGGGWLPRTLAFVDGRSGRVSGWWLGGRGCVVPSLAAVELPLCPGVEAGQVRASGVAPTANVRARSQPWVALVAGQGLRWAFVERVALIVDATLLIALVRGGRFLIDDVPLTTIAALGFRGGLGLELRL